MNGEKYMIWGGNGWIGQMLCKLLEKEGNIVIKAKSRLQDYMGIAAELEEIKPNYVLNVAGITGNPTVDWCEDHKQDTYLININGTLNLADACWRKNIHMTYYATGCIYVYDNEHPLGTKFTEKDSPNFSGSTYSNSKRLVEEALKIYDNVLILRIRMPISDKLEPKNLLSKLTKYAKVINIPNSVTILPEMLPISLKMTKSKITGIYNFTNPGTITHNEILSLYKKYINPDFVWSNFTVEEQDNILKSKRSNCYLDTSKLEELYPITEIKQSLEILLQKISHS